MWSSLIWALLILIIIIFFKSSLNQLLKTLIGVSNKAQKLKYGNFSLELGEKTAIYSTNTQEDYADTKQREYSKAFQSNIVTHEEELIRSQLSKAKMTTHQAIDILINHLSHQHLFVKLLQIDRLIYKEQVKLLQRLNVHAKPIPETKLLEFYNNWLESGGNKDYTPQNFLEFLSSQNLIIAGIDGYGISMLGKEYLTYLVRIGREIEG